MTDFDLMRQLHRSKGGRIVLLIMDGLGGLPMELGGVTELEAAATPNMDELAAAGCLGQLTPITAGITPGSGPAHLALFGYDPLVYEVGRGVLEATGVGMEVASGDVAARGNFCTLDDRGLILDRRAGRISTELALPLAERLAEIQVPGAEFTIQHVKEYRFALLCSGEGLQAEIEDTDPQQVGAAPLPAKAIGAESEKAAQLYNQWIEEARRALEGEEKANGVTLRGFSTNPNLPSFGEIYGLRAICSAVYPMYKGVSKLVGMDLHEFTYVDLEGQIGALADIWQDYDFYFIHVKPTDSRGEDGDFEAKAAVIEGVDRALPALLDYQPDVLAITGDHSTPARLRTHSWHPIPFLLWAPASARPDEQTSFGETACSKGGLGNLHSTDAMSLLMAHADRLDKYGA